MITLSSRESIFLALKYFACREESFEGVKDFKLQIQQDC